jgi:hypothetical protein
MKITNKVTLVVLILLTTADIPAPSLGEEYPQSITVIYTKDGRVIRCEMGWIEGDEVKCQKFGGILGIKLDRIDEKRTYAESEQEEKAKRESSQAATTDSNEPSSRKPEKNLMEEQRSPATCGDLQRRMCTVLMNAMMQYWNICQTYPEGYERDKYTHQLKNVVFRYSLEFSKEIGPVDGPLKVSSPTLKVFEDFPIFPLFIIDSESASKGFPPDLDAEKRVEEYTDSIRSLCGECMK